MDSKGTISGILVDTEAEQYIEELIRFLGADNVAKFLRKYNRSRENNKKRLIYTRYYLTDIHPWYEALLRYIKLKGKFGKLPVQYIDQRLQTLAADAYMIYLLRERTSFPAAVLNKFRSDLIMEENANPYILELKMALHYLRSGFEIEWVKGNSKMPEFTAIRPDYSFQVECKYIRFDTGKNFRRRDFYLLADILLTEISRAGLTGDIHIDFNKKLPSNLQELQALSRVIAEAAAAKRTVFSLETGAGEVRLSLRPKSDVVLPAGSFQAELNSRKPDDTIMAVWSDNIEQIRSTLTIRNPLVLTFRNTQSVNILSKVRDAVKEAIAQIGETLPGVVTMYLEGYKKGDLAWLREREEFQGFSNSLFDLEGAEKVAAISYAIGPYIKDMFGGEHISMEALVYDNPGCAQRPPEGFRFVTTYGSL